jgi:hypothetical protein
MERRECMQDEDLRLRNLEEHIVHLEKRVAALEGLAPPPLRETPFPGNEAGGKRQGTGGGGSESPQDVEGTLSYTAFAQFAQRRVHLKHQQSLAQIFQVAPEALAHLFAALSSPPYHHPAYPLHRTAQQATPPGTVGDGISRAILPPSQRVAGGGPYLRTWGSYSIEMEAIIPICIALMIAAQLALPDLRNLRDWAVSDQEQAEPERE